jgi:hypothetical protein
VCPGNAPHVVDTKPYASAGQWFTATDP